MSKVYYVTCPECGFRYYVGENLVTIPRFPTLCPRCHHLYQLEESPDWEPPSHAPAGTPKGQSAKATL